ncbi:CoA ester lyase [Microvirga sp. W0021]|uniref:CoA ester lyase n=1 Tax=Hohaiivirga grylli TaxID=3133970 RepID=A0ABV0BF54_9HYPH
MTVFRPRRSALYVPGSNARALAKAGELGTDVVILDLEDAVSPQAKLEARDCIAKQFEKGFGDKEVVIRVNGAETPWGEEDLTFCASVKPDAVLVPKVSNASTIMTLARTLDRLAMPQTTRIWTMVETPLAILNIANIASVAQDPASRLSCLVMGTNDLIKETRVRSIPGRANQLPWLSTSVAAARAYDLAILDGVYNKIDDQEGFAEECQQAVDFGFDGKTLIHPSQIEVANTLFSPSDNEIAYAQALVAFFEQPENADKGVLSFNGQMVERLHLEMARRTLMIARAASRV